MAEPSRTSVPTPLAPGAARGRRVAQIVFFAVLVWVIVSGSAQILAEGFFQKRIPRDAAACRAELALLRTRLADASLVASDGKGELGAVASFREALGGEAGRSWDVRATELVDGCPPEESAAAYALARLRASHEAMVRIDAQQVAPARDAYKKSSPKTP
jgi:hypothetical protein